MVLFFRQWRMVLRKKKSSGLLIFKKILMLVALLMRFSIYIFFTYFFVFFCPIFPDQQMSGMFNKLNGPILSSWQYAPGLNLFSSQWKSSCPINYILNKYPLHHISINKQNRQNLHFREGYPFTSSHFEP